MSFRNNKVLDGFFWRRNNRCYIMEDIKEEEDDVNGKLSEHLTHLCSSFPHINQTEYSDFGFQQLLKIIL